MNGIFEKIERETIPEIVRAIGFGDAFVAAKDDGMIQFRIASRENLDDTKGAGKWREFIRGEILAAGAADVKVSAIVSPVNPDTYTLYAVTALAEEKTFLAGR